MKYECSTLINVAVEASSEEEAKNIFLNNLRDSFYDLQTSDVQVEEVEENTNHED